jgi:CHAT domain-containing protein/predicted negative regulator of RcsB-dependent stress response
VSIRPGDPAGGNAAPISALDFLQMGREERDSYLRKVADPASALLQFGNECERLASTDPSAAASMLRDLREACGNDATFAAARARAARAEVLSLAYLGRFQEAITLAQAARADSAAHGARIESARIRLAAMQPLLKVGRHDEALAEGALASAELAAEGAHSLAARAHINLGNVLKAIDQPARALEQLDQALPMVAGDAALEATVLNTRGEALMQLDRFNEARDSFSAAIAHFAARSEPFAWAIAEGNLADLAARVGDLGVAFERFASARARLPSQAAGHGARLLLEESEVFEATGLPHIAAERLAAARSALAALGMPLESRRAALASARLALSRGDHSEALAALSGTLWHDAPDAADIVVMAMRALASAGVAALAGAGPATTHAEQSIDALAQRAGSAETSVRTIIATDLLAQARELMGHHLAALDAARRAADGAARLGLATLVGATCTTRARLARAEGLLDEAVDAGRAAVAATERTRASFGADRLRVAFLGSRLSPYEQLILSLVQRGGSGSAEEAMSVAELARSRTLIDRLIGSLPEADRDPHDPEAATLRERLMGLHAKLASAAGDDARSAALSPVQAQLIETELRLERHLTERASRHANAAAVRTAAGPTAWRSKLGPDDALVEYVEAEGRLLAFVATRDRVRVIELARDAAAINDAIAKLHFRIRRRLRAAGCASHPGSTDVEHLIARLADAAWAPLHDALGNAHRVIVAPCGALHSMPIAAIAQHSGIGDRQVVIVPSASVWTRLAERQAHVRGGAALVVGVADESAPRIAHEIAAVARILETERDVRVLEGPAATARAVSEQLADPDVGVAHLACHGQFIPDAPHASGLRLHDRWLSVREIAALPHTPHHVVLSGCETGASSLLPGEEILGLPRAFLARGTTMVVGSLWNVGDQDTFDLMVDFHSRWGTVPSAGRPSMAGALSAAQRSRRAAEPHPAHWASFIAIGYDS